MCYTKIRDMVNNNLTMSFFNEFGINGNQSPGIGSGLIVFKS
jgi:hypothetical protein